MIDLPKMIPAKCFWNGEKKFMVIILEEYKENGCHISSLSSLLLSWKFFQFLKRKLNEELYPNSY